MDEKRDTMLSSIGFVLVFMMLLVFTVMGTMMEDKRNLTLARMFVSPVREWHIIGGNLLGGLFLGLIQLVPILLVVRWAFGIPWVGGILEMAVIFTCFLVAAIGLGIGLSGLIKNGFNPVVLIATVIVPTSILGGSFIPDSMLPSIMSKLGYAVPQKWVMMAIREIMNGAALSDIMVNMGILLMFGLAFATFGVKTIRPIND